MTASVEECVEVPVAGGRLEVRVVGEAEGGGGRPTVVLVHGLLVSSHVWDPVVPLLAPHVRLVLPDLPLGAHRRALNPRAQRTVPALADRLARVIEDTCDEPPVVVGNDTGGAVVQHLCARRPDVVGSLVLASCDAYWNCPPWPLWPALPLFRVPGFVHLFARLARVDAVQRQLVQLVARRVPPPGERAALLGGLFDDPGVRRDLAGVVRALHPGVTRSTVHTLAAWDRPTTVVWGRPDAVFPARLARRLAATIPGAELVWVDGSRALLPLDRPTAFADALLAHVSRSHGGGRPGVAPA
ncbi:MAG TPA: alpha/beta hydrolase [Acidimicrobiales bacterium]